MTKKILLTCAGGFSTSMLVEKMKETAKKQQLEVIIDACGEGALEKNLPADVILIGPQMSHAESKIKGKVGESVPVAVIDMMDYGTMNGEKVLNTALKLLNL